MNRDMILDMWARGLTADMIADSADCSRDHVFATLRRARMDCDIRAARRAYQAPARRRKMKIDILRRLNVPTKAIASMLGITERMVQIRLREMA